MCHSPPNKPKIGEKKGHNWVLFTQKIPPPPRNLGVFWRPPLKPTKLLRTLHQNRWNGCTPPSPPPKKWKFLAASLWHHFQILVNICTVRCFPCSSLAFWPWLSVSLCSPPSPLKYYLISCQPESSKVSKVFGYYWILGLRTIGFAGM